MDTEGRDCQPLTFDSGGRRQSKLSRNSAMIRARLLRSIAKPIRPSSGMVWRHCRSKYGKCSGRQVRRRWTIAWASSTICSAEALAVLAAASMRAQNSRACPTNSCGTFVAVRADDSGVSTYGNVSCVPDRKLDEATGRRHSIYQLIGFYHTQGLSSRGAAARAIVEEQTAGIGCSIPDARDRSQA